jgi:hypothetical protein
MHNWILAVQDAGRHIGGHDHGAPDTATRLATTRHAINTGPIAGRGAIDGLAATRPCGQAESTLGIFQVGQARMQLGVERRAADH